MNARVRDFVTTDREKRLAVQHSVGGERRGSEQVRELRRAQRGPDDPGHRRACRGRQFDRIEQRSGAPWQSIRTTDFPERQRVSADSAPAVAYCLKLQF